MLNQCIIFLQNFVIINQKKYVITEYVMSGFFFNIGLNANVQGHFYVTTEISLRPSTLKTSLSVHIPCEPCVPTRISTLYKPSRRKMNSKKYCTRTIELFQKKYRVLLVLSSHPCCRLNELLTSPILSP